MARYRSFIFSDATVGETSVILDGRESHHLVKVFRARTGEAVELLDGQGRRYQGRLFKADAKAAEITIESVEEVPRPRLKITLLQSVPKGKAMDLILRMATEIGASAIQPVFTHQGEVQLKGERLASKLDKWALSMIEACKQCGLSFLPELCPPMALNDWLSREQKSTRALRVVACLEAGSQPLKRVFADHAQVDELVVAVGPEGDFSEEEYAALRAAGFKPVRLGLNVLRAETAAAYILSVADQLLGQD